MHRPPWPIAEHEVDDPPGVARRRVRLEPLPRAARTGFDPDAKTPPMMPLIEPTHRKPRPGQGRLDLRREPVPVQILLPFEDDPADPLDAPAWPQVHGAGDPDDRGQA